MLLCVGENYWVFDAERQIRGPESIRTLGLSVSGIQAALRWGHDSTYDTYFFKSGSYWRFSPHQNRVESAYPRSMQDWSGIPNDVDASFRDLYGTEQHLYTHILIITTPFLLLLQEGITELQSTFPARLSGYAHFIRGRQYWKFDPVGMNSLEGYPRYVGVDFFACRNA